MAFSHLLHSPSLFPPLSATFPYVCQLVSPRAPSMSASFSVSLSLAHYLFLRVKKSIGEYSPEVSIRFFANCSDRTRLSVVYRAARFDFPLHGVVEDFLIAAKCSREPLLFATNAAERFGSPLHHAALNQMARSAA
jgi:hypothetical protein